MSTPISLLLDNVKWSKIDAPMSVNNDLPYVTHSGILDLAGFKLEVFQLSNGQRVIDAQDVERFFE